MRSAAAAFKTAWAPSAHLAACPLCEGIREADRVALPAVRSRVLKSAGSRGWFGDTRHQGRGRATGQSQYTPARSETNLWFGNPPVSTRVQAYFKPIGACGSRLRVGGTLEQDSFLPKSRVQGLDSRSSSGRRSVRRNWRIHAAAASSDGRNFYELLGVPQSADDREIKKAYRRMALKYHPDVNKEKDAEAVFVKIKQAYTTLSDSQSRSQYDLQLRGGWGFPSGGSSDWDPLDPFGYKKKPRGKKLEEDEFYGIGEFFQDLQKEVEGWQKDRATSKAPKSLWEEMSEVGEEFVEFLEQELGLDEKESKKRTDRRTGSSSSNGAGSQARSQQKADKAKEGDGVGVGGTRYPKDEKEKGSEIDDLLANLKKEMGL